MKSYRIDLARQITLDLVREGLVSHSEFVPVSRLIRARIAEARERDRGDKRIAPIREDA
jgi:hypothetical protein